MLAHSRPQPRLWREWQTPRTSTRIGRLTMTPRPRKVFERYHAHVYFDRDTIDRARALCESAASQFGVAMGRVHEKLVGPHPRWSCQLAFDSQQFERLIPWLDAHRDGLTILVHGLTGRNLEDHTANASWLGEPVELNLEMFR
jgi:DOPA 4,5-dioxygenase